MKNAWVGSVALLLAVAWACGGNDDNDNADASALADGGTGASSGLGPGTSSGTLPSDGGGSSGNPASATSLGPLREPFARLGVIGSKPNDESPREWRLRVYPAGPSRAEDGTWCSEPLRIGECFSERCEAGEQGPDPDAGTERWSGTITVTNENTSTSIVTDLATLARSTTVQIVELLALPNTEAGHVLHIVAPDVTGLPPIDVRATVPSDPRIQLEDLDTRAFRHAPEPGALRIDMSVWNGFPPRLSGACVFDRTIKELTLPPLDTVNMQCGGENIRVVPVGQWMTVIDTGAGSPALVYVGTANITHALRVIDCNQLFSSN